LDLLQFATCNVAKTSAGTAEVMWCQLRKAKLCRVIFDNVPHDSVCYETAPGLPGSANTPKKPSASYTSSRKPIVDRLLHPIRNRDRPNVPTFACQVNYCPMVFPTLEIIHLQFGQFASAQPTGEKYRQNRSISLPLQGPDVRQLAQLAGLVGQEPISKTNTKLLSALDAADSSRLLGTQ
jgi:hypothetical protein